MCFKDKIDQGLVGIAMAQRGRWVAIVANRSGSRTNGSTSVRTVSPSS